jgi:hypothetical protein
MVIYEPKGNALVVIKLKVKAIGEDTMLMSDVIVTLLSKLALGVKDMEPLSILKPDLLTIILTDLGELSIKKLTKKLDIEILILVDIYESPEERLFIVILCCKVELPFDNDLDVNLLSL